MTRLVVRPSFIACLGAAALLGGCNIVVSPTPVFTAADSVGAPTLRGGLWVSTKPDCAFQETKPLASWPDCADSFMAVAGGLRAAGEKGRGKPASPYVIAAGDPLVLQAQPDVEVGGGADASASGGATASASASVTTTQSGPPPYVFLAVHPLALDAQGRMIRIEEWPVMCGPPPPDPKPDTPIDKQSSVTEHPLPGLKIEGQVCTPAGKAAVLGAAKASRAYGPLQTSHWVRDDER